MDQPSVDPRDLDARCSVCNTARAATSGGYCEDCADDLTGKLNFALAHGALPRADPASCKHPNIEGGRCLRCQTEVCSLCVKWANETIAPSHDGSANCESGSLASGGKNPHCTCDTCF